RRQVREQREKMRRERERGKRNDPAVGSRNWTDKDQKELTALALRLRDLSLMARPTARDTINDLGAQVVSLQDSLHADRKNAEAASSLKAAMERLEEAARPAPALVNSKTLTDQAGKPFAVEDVPAADKTNKKNGRALFIEKGCLACHSHTGAAIKYDDDEGNTVTLVGDATFAPELSRVANKLLAGKDGKEKEAG